MRHTGIAASPGMAEGKVRIFTAAGFREEAKVSADRDVEWDRFLTARERAAGELEELRLRFREEGEKAALFGAQREILLDEELEGEIRAGIDGGDSGPRAVQRACEGYAALLEGLEDPVLRERAADVRDICARLLRCWQGVPQRDLSRLEEPVILAAEELLPSEAATLDREKVLAIVTEQGGYTSHTAILARKEGIPAVLGVKGLLDRLTDGESVLLDGERGLVMTCPTPEERTEWLSRTREWERERLLAAEYLDAEPVTSDAVRVEISLNLTDADDRELTALAHADGVGLFRTEFLFLGRTAPPSEEEQYRIYRKVLTACSGRPVVLRTLDAGDDKALDYLSDDGGRRGLALCLDRPELFRSQLRAALRASVHGDLRIMFPMVTCREEFCRGKALLETVKGELVREGIPVDTAVKVGMMVEVPALARDGTGAAEAADFASIGTNDLAQFLLGENRREAGDHRFRPELFRLVEDVIRAFRRAGKPVAVCGELAGDPRGAAVLLGLGVRRLSMNGTAIPAVKKMLRGMEIGRAEELARRVCAMSGSEEVKAYLTGQIGT